MKRVQATALTMGLPRSAVHSSQKILHTFFLFLNEFPEKYVSYIKRSLLGINFPKVTLHVFACDSENYIEKLSWNYSCEIAFQLHKIMFLELYS